jgi:hypothetical protein
LNVIGSELMLLDSEATIRAARLKGSHPQFEVCKLPREE